jgi:hypothetical protein
MLRHLVITLIISALCGSVAAQEVTPLNDVELKDQVGGLRTPSGIEFGFGAVVNTYVDGKLQLQSQLTFTDHGAIKVNSPGVPGDTAGSGITVSGPVPGIFLPATNGGTVILHDLGDGRIGSVVLNTADNRDIRQDTILNLNIPDLQNFQKDVTGQVFSAKLQDAVQRALVDFTP